LPVSRRRPPKPAGGRADAAHAKIELLIVEAEAAVSGEVGLERDGRGRGQRVGSALEQRKLAGDLVNSVAMQEGEKNFPVDGTGELGEELGTGGGADHPRGDP